MGCEIRGNGDRAILGYEASEGAERLPAPLPCCNGGAGIMHAEGIDK